MVLKIIAIGDPHIKCDNIKQVDIFIERIKQIIVQKKPDLIVVLGDLLHTHEKIHVIPLNKAYEFIFMLSSYALTYVIVGNHDMLSNQVFLTDEHWMNGMKPWKNIVIVDKIMVTNIRDEKLVFAPYVYAGRFIEALSTVGDDWKDASCIFCHQEFKGCKLGAIDSIEGDEWDTLFPNIISGHIHKNQTLNNIYYPGSCLQHAYGESNSTIIPYIELKNKKYVLEECDLKLPKKIIIYLDMSEIETYEIISSNVDEIKIVLSGVYEEFKSFKKSKKYNDIIRNNIKVVYKHKNITNISTNIEKFIHNNKVKSFDEIIHEKLGDEKNTDLLDLYKTLREI